VSESSGFVALPRSGSRLELAQAAGQLRESMSSHLGALADLSEESRMVEYTNHLVAALQLLDPNWFGRLGGADPGGSSPGGSSPGGSSPGGSSPGGSSPGGSSPGGSSPGGSSPGGSSPGESRFHPDDYADMLKQLGVLVESAVNVLERQLSSAGVAQQHIVGLQDLAGQLAAVRPEQFSSRAEIGVTSPFEGRGRSVAPQRTDEG